MSGPFVLGADHYLAAGWHPFPAYHTKDKSKAPCVPKWSRDGVKHSVIGWDAVDVTPELVAGWKVEYPTAQLGLRLPKNVIGIDVDMYDGKTGRTRLRELVLEYGALSPTWVSTSRTDGSGIWLFHVEDSSQFPHDLGGGIEVIRWCGRFVMAAPSTHPKTGDPYGWIRPGERDLLFDEFPSALGSDLAPLPARFVAGLRKEARHRPSAAGIGPNDVRSWIVTRPGGTGEPCAGMRRTFDKYNSELQEAGEGSRHTAALTGVYALVGDSTEGHSGLFWSLKQFSKTLVDKRGSKDTADGEFYRLVHGEVEKRMGQPVGNEDPCSVSFEGWGK
jgi:hypothetical protein